MRGFLPLLAAIALALALRLPLAAVSVDDVRWPVGIQDDRLVGQYGSVRIPDEPWVLLLGGSTVFHGFDAAGLEPVRKQTYARGLPSDLALSLSWTLRRQLPADRRPARVIWGLQLASLVDRKGEGGHPCATTLATGRPDPRLLDPLGDDPGCADLAATATIAERAGLAHDRLDPWYARRATTRDAVVSALRVAWSGTLPDPRPEEGRYVGQSRAVLDRNLAAWQAMGVFDAPGADPRQARAVDRVVELCREAGIPLTLISMPEPSAVRARYAPASRAWFDELLRTHADEVIDLWSALPDGAFFDQAHANEEGRPQLTARLRGSL